MSEKQTLVTVEEAGKGPYIQTIRAANHAFEADEPIDMGGQDKGPAPYDLLLAALGACTAMTVRMYADHKQWPLEKIAVRLTHRKDEAKADLITRDITVTGALDETQRQRLLEIADKCPIHRTLENRPAIESKLVL